jgi:hypothetical protein
MADIQGVGGLVETMKAEVERLKDQLAAADARASGEAAKTAQAITAFEAMAEANRPSWWRWLASPTEGLGGIASRCLHASRRFANFVRRPRANARHRMRGVRAARRYTVERLMTQHRDESCTRSPTARRRLLDRLQGGRTLDRRDNAID